MARSHQSSRWRPRRPRWLAVEIMWAWLVAVELASLTQDYDNHLKCLCSTSWRDADELLLSPELQLLSKSFSATQEGGGGGGEASASNISKQVIQDNILTVDPQRPQLDKNEGATASGRQQDADNRRQSSAVPLEGARNDLRAARRVAAAQAESVTPTATAATATTTTTWPIIDNQEASAAERAARAAGSHSLIERGRQRRRGLQNEDVHLEGPSHYATRRASGASFLFHHHHQRRRRRRRHEHEHEHSHENELELGERGRELEAHKRKCLIECSPADRDDDDDDDDDVGDEDATAARRPGANRKGQFCASDGRIYSSLCAMRRRACQLNTHLHRMRSLAACNGRQLKWPLAETLDATASATAEPLDSSDSLSPLSPLPLPPVVGRAKLACTRNGHYETFKEALWREFNENVELMFSYLDADADQLIEARELWPRRPIAAAPGKCPIGRHFAAAANCQLGNGTAAAGVDEDEDEEAHDDGLREPAGQIMMSAMMSTEFAFEPHFQWSPCSLSHLMLFELQREGDKFDRHSFSRVFAELETAAAAAAAAAESQSGSQTNGNVIQRTRHTDTTHVLMSLGDYQTLSCLSKQLEADLQATLSNSIGDKLVPSPSLSCTWQRHATSLASLRDEHIQLIPMVATSESDYLGEPPHGPGIQALASTKLTKLHIKDAQLYLSGPYECACQLGSQTSFVHKYQVQISAQPHVSVRPQIQWSLPNSRISFDCHHDFIDTSLSGGKRAPPLASIEWLRVDPQSGRESQIVDTHRIKRAEPTSSLPAEPNFDMGFDETPNLSSSSSWSSSSNGTSSPAATCSARASISHASSRLILDKLVVADSGEYRCRLNVTLAGGGGDNGVPTVTSGSGSARLLVSDQPPRPARAWKANEQRFLWLFHEGGISIYSLPPAATAAAASNDGIDVGASPLVDEQELELVRELSGHSEIRAEVDGNWNQLTLCGGLSADQAVICEWSDNAIALIVSPDGDGDNDGDNARDKNGANASEQQERQDEWSAYENHHGGGQRRYIYVGQPNLNRLLVLDGRELTIVGVINTEPQPRQLFASRPNKIHLNKWVRRRLSPVASARWLQAAIKSRAAAAAAAAAATRTTTGPAQPLEPTLTPKSSRLYPDKQQNGAHDHDNNGGRAGGGGRLRNQMLPKLVQHDIWLLCYGQPLVVDPALELGAGDAADLSGEPTGVGQQTTTSAGLDAKQNRSAIWERGAGPRVSSWPVHEAPRYWAPARQAGATSNGEARLRNRKSIQIIQSTFFAERARPHASVHMHSETETTTTMNNGLEGAEDEKEYGDLQYQVGAGQRNDRNGPESSSAAAAEVTHDERGQIEAGSDWPAGPAPERLFAAEPPQTPPRRWRRRRNDGANARRNESGALRAVNEFKRLSVLTTHYVMAGQSLRAPQLDELKLMQTQRRRPADGIDLVQDLSVPRQPDWLAGSRYAASQIPSARRRSSSFKLHYAYAMHYEQRQLYRISMDGYHYDRQIELDDCDPIELLVASLKGHLIIQCREPITHEPLGQLVLDELTGAKLQFNANIRAQTNYLSPDSRYLVSVLTNQTERTGRGTASTTSHNGEETSESQNATSQDQTRRRRTTIIYVQQVNVVSGLELLYEIKTVLEIVQCSFVWREGHYVAVLVALNRRDQVSELLSLRLADSRLELMVRAPGLAEDGRSRRRREPLNLRQDSKVASLTTSEGTYIVDLVDNRIVQTLRQHHPHHQTSPPTLLWA